MSHPSLKPGSREAAQYALTGPEFWRDRVFSHNFVRSAYNRVFRMNSSYVAAILVAAIGVEVFFDGVTNFAWRRWNAGKLWPDVERSLLAKEKQNRGAQ